MQSGNLSRLDKSVSRLSLQKVVFNPLLNCFGKKGTGNNKTFIHRSTIKWMNPYEVRIRVNCEVSKFIHSFAVLISKLTPMDLSSFRQNFEKNRNRQKYHHSLKEHPTFTKIAKFGCEML